MAQEDYDQGMADGLAGQHPQFERLALGANRLNDYERDYIHSGDRERMSPLPGQAVHQDCGHPDWPDCPHYGAR